MTPKNPDRPRGRENRLGRSPRRRAPPQFRSIAPAMRSEIWRLARVGAPAIDIASSFLPCHQSNDSRPRLLCIAERLVSSERSNGYWESFSSTEAGFCRTAPAFYPATSSRREKLIPLQVRLVPAIVYFIPFLGRRDLAGVGFRERFDGAAASKSTAAPAPTAVP